MTVYAVSPEALQAVVAAALGDKVLKIGVARGELSVDVDAAVLRQVALTLRDAPGCQFEQLIDLCGVDYSDYKGVGRDGPRFSVVLHLLSVSLNQRLRVRVAAPDDDLPMLPSVTAIWSSANWFEREAFDLFGIVFEGHDDLRRILTDYGFIGHPFRKDFPLIGNVEVRYDPIKQRVVYEPVSIESRTLVPRVIRHDNRYDPALGGN